MVLPASQCEALKRQLQHIRLIHQQDLAAGGEWVFPRRNRWKDATGKEGRNHLDPSMVQKFVKKAVKAPAFPSWQVAILFAIRSQPICWSVGKINDLFPPAQARADGRHQPSRPPVASVTSG
jgi:hypothetical protein